MTMIEQLGKLIHETTQRADLDGTGVASLAILWLAEELHSTDPRTAGALWDLHIDHVAAGWAELGVDVVAQEVQA